MSLTPGRELDALIAEKVMGLKAHPKWANEGMLFDGEEAEPYSTSIAAAWEVVAQISKISAFDCLALLGPTDECDKWFARFDRKWHGRSGDLHDFYKWDTYALTAPHAICLAALKAIGHATD